MSRAPASPRRLRRVTGALVALSLGQAALASPPVNGGPFNARFMPGGIGIVRDLEQAEPLAAADAPYSLAAWVRWSSVQAGEVTLFALGDDAALRALVLQGGRIGLREGALSASSTAALQPGRWTHLALVSDGRAVTLYVDGRPVLSRPSASIAVRPQLRLAPVIDGQSHFGGDLVGARVEAGSIDPAAEAGAPPAFDIVQMLEVGVGWPFQRKANIGLTEQQDPWLLPRGKGPVSPPIARPIIAAPSLAPAGQGIWQIGRWKMIEAPRLAAGADGTILSRPGVDTRSWHTATVPGTALTTLVDRGVYPDPYYGLNNLAIPERLARQDYWYRTSFVVPPEAAGRRLALRFNGVNYAAEVWLNGQPLGTMKGAFTRGRFAFVAQAGDNVVAVRVSPPPHPGIPHEQSVAAGPGENGGQLAIDGPTFVATEGWDWIPGIRDRNTGLWQGVDLLASGDVTVGDPQVVTDLPLPRTDSADVRITVPLVNHASTPRDVTVRAAFGSVRVERKVKLAPGAGAVRFTPDSDPVLRVPDPALWWPNGYGDPTLQRLTIEASIDGQISDRTTLRFGIREVSYELSLFDSRGVLRRVEVDPTDGTRLGQRLVDVRHAAIKQSPLGWAQSLTRVGETSPAVREIPATYALPHLAIRVNGVRIAARGGSWGMDDAMKRIGRARLEPYFRLEREANMNVIRNWMGNNTEPEFYDLADENGLMVLNDFWQSTQDFQIEPDDPALFLENARDTIARYRNHPSIILWFGRNEGVPYPRLNEGLDDLVAELDGTRWYTGSSNVVNLQGSGPYNYRPPADYFTTLASGFSVETGTPSLATREAVAASTPAADRWPLGDTMAYHDWHFGGNGDTRSFMAALDTMFGPASSFEDFERKAQMMNLETHKAMMEGFLGHLWTRNSGRLFWMTHPSWPSNAWQLYSWDYDTHAAYYGAKSAAEPLHIQLNQPDNALVVVNTTRAPAKGLVATTRVFDLANHTLLARSDRLDAAANQVTALPPVALDTVLGDGRMVLVSLRLSDAQGRVISENRYWRGHKPEDYRALATLPQVPVRPRLAPVVTEGPDRVLRVTLINQGKAAALATKVTLVDPAGTRILPAFYSDNYVTLLPGETRVITIRYPARVEGSPQVTLRGWNVAPTE